MQKKLQYVCRESLDKCEDCTVMKIYVVPQQCRPKLESESMRDANVRQTGLPWTCWHVIMLSLSALRGRDWYRL